MISHIYVLTVLRIQLLMLLSLLQQSKINVSVLTLRITEYGTSNYRNVVVLNVLHTRIIYSYFCSWTIV